MTLMVQAAVLDGLLFDAPLLSQDGLAAIEMDVGRGQVADARVVTVVVVVVDEGGDGSFEFALEKVVLEQDAVPEGLVPARDLALGLGMHRRTTDVLHAFVLEVFGRILCDVGRTIIAEKPRFVPDFGTLAARGARAMSWVSVTSSARISVTPDLELSVRGDLEPRERILFEQPADQFRAILTGRTKND